VADDRIDVRITVDASQAKEGFKEAQDAAKEMGEAVKSAGARAGEGLRKPLEVSQAQMREALAAAGGDVNKALRSLGELGTEAAKAGEKLKANSKGLADSLAQIGQNLAANLQTDARHLIAIFDEVQRGQRGAMIASISALARDSGALDTAIKGVGATATWFVTSPMGLVAAGIAGIIATIAAGIAQLHHMEAELRRVGAEALAMGRQPAEAVESYEKLKAAIPSGEDAEAIAQAIERIPSLSEEARASIAKIAPAMLEAQFGGDIKALEKHLPGIFGSTGEMTAFVEKNRLLGGEQLAAFLGASRATQAEMLAKALATRYGPFQTQLKEAADVGAAMALGLAGIAPSPKAILAPPVTALPRAPAVMPSQADIDAIEAIRKASPHRLLVEQLQQQIKTIEAGIAGLPASLQAQARAAIEKLQDQIKKLQSLPGYQAGGIVPADQVAMVHAGEMVLPADLSALIQSLARGGGRSGDAAGVVYQLRDAADRLASASTELGLSAKDLDVSADAINATMRGLEHGLDEALFGARRRAIGTTLGEEALRAGLKSLTASLLKDLQSGLTSLLFGSQATSFGAGLSNLLFGPGGFGGLAFGSQGLSGLLGLGAGGLASAAFGQGIASTGIFPAIGGWISGLFSSGGGLAAFLGLERGGIVPSAAGGWVVPHFQAGGILGVLHQREMVLPADLSEGMQSMIARGGGGHTFNLHVSAWDARSVMNAGPQLVAALNNALRNGAMLRAPS
jgi:hypothetical protein